MFDWIKRFSRRDAPAVNAEMWTGLDSAQLLKFVTIPTASGAPVTTESAMRVSAVYACVRLIAGAIASLPCHVYTTTKTGREKVGRTDLWYLLNETPSPDWTSASMWEWTVRSVLLCGDGFVWIRRRDRNAVPSELVPIDPLTVTQKKTDGGRVYVFSIDGETQSAFADDILHFPGVGFDGKRSLSVIQHAARESIGTAIQTDRFAGKFFAQGATPPVIIKAPGKLTQAQIDQLRNLWVERIGGVDNAHLPLVLTEGVDATALKVSAVDSQMLETRQFQVVDIARAFGVPPFMIGETEKTSSWGSGVEMMSIGFVRYTLGPHLRRFEQELNRKLFRRAPKFVEFSVEGLLRGDSKARSEFYRSAIGGGGAPAWMTPNEIRAIENLPPVEDGDELFDPNDVRSPDPQPDPTDPATPAEPATDPADPATPAEPATD